MEVVTFKMPSLYKGINAQRVYGEIEDIGENVSADDIVDKAKNSSTELHKCFEWDDTVAGHEYRKIQARELVRQLVVTVEDKEEEPPIQLRVFQPSQQGGYKPTKLIVRQKDEYESLLQRAWNELRAFKEKYQTLSELEEIINLIP